MTDLEFWQAVYLAATTAGSSHQLALTRAREALDAMRAGKK